MSKDVKLLLPARPVVVTGNFRYTRSYATLEHAEMVEGRLKYYWTEDVHGVLCKGDYYLHIPETCPYSGHPCRGGGCSPCEYVP